MIGEIQARMQAAVVRGTVDAAAIADVREDTRLAAKDRLAIYARGYRLRLLDCLRGEYPKLAALAGPTTFELFANGYIAAHPSRSSTLYDFGAGFADYLDTARPLGDDDLASVAAVPAALARIERAVAEVARARGLERRPRAPTDDGDASLFAWLGLPSGRRYRRPDSVRLLALPFDFMPLLNASGAAQLPMPVAQSSYLAVARQDYRVRCHALAPDAYRWLARLPALDAAEAGAPSAAAPAWLPFAEANGLVVAV